MKRTAFTVFLVLSSCGDVDAEGGAETLSEEEFCVQLAEAYCDQVLDCLALDGYPSNATDEQNCIEAAKDSIDCDRGYCDSGEQLNVDTGLMCIDDMATMECSEMYRMVDGERGAPASCDEVCE